MRHERDRRERPREKSPDARPKVPTLILRYATNPSSEVAEGAEAQLLCTRWAEETSRRVLVDDHAHPAGQEVVHQPSLEESQFGVTLLSCLNCGIVRIKDAGESILLASGRQDQRDSTNIAKVDAPDSLPERVQFDEADCAWRPQVVGDKSRVGTRDRYTCRILCDVCAIQSLRNERCSADR